LCAAAPLIKELAGLHHPGSPVPEQVDLAPAHVSAALTASLRPHSTACEAAICGARPLGTSRYKEEVVEVP